MKKSELLKQYNYIVRTFYPFEFTEEENKAGGLLLWKQAQENPEKLREDIKNYIQNNDIEGEELQEHYKLLALI